MEERIEIQSDDLRIEGLLEKGTGSKGVVITHPHPLYGGDMFNVIVASLARVHQLKGYSTLRINMRGTGSSQGSYDNGIGEQRDVLSALSCLREMGINDLALAGYSFGAWINALAVSGGEQVDQLVMVSPPVGFVDFTSIGLLPSLRLIVTGSQDDIAPADMIREMLPEWNENALLIEIDGADHFYSGYVDRLEAMLNENLQS